MYCFAHLCDIVAVLTTEGCIAEHFSKSKAATPPQTEGGTRRVSRDVATGIGEISVWVVRCFLGPTVTALSKLMVVCVLEFSRGSHTAGLTGFLVMYPAWGRVVTLNRNKSNLLLVVAAIVYLSVIDKGLLCILSIQ